MTTNKDTVENDLELFRDLINKSNDAIFVNDPHSGLFIFVNDEACASLGYDRHELLKMGVMDIETTFPDNLSWQKHVKEVRQRGHLMLEGIHKRKDGSTFPGEINISYVAINTREYMVAVVRDVTERKQAEETVRQSGQLTAAMNRISKAFLTGKEDEEMYDEVLRVVLEVMQSPYGVFGYIDERGALVCPSMTRHIWSKCQMSHKSIIFPVETWGDSIWGEGLRTGLPRYQNAPFSVPRGHVPIDRCLTVPLLYMGCAIGLLTVANKGDDYTDDDLNILRQIGEQVAPVLQAKLERERSARALQESEDRLYQTIRVSQIGIFDHNHLTDSIYWSPRQREIHGWGPDETVSLQAFFGLVHPEDLDRIMTEVKRAHDPASDGFWDVEHRIIRRDGSTRWLTARSQTFFDGEGSTRRPVRTVGAILDITERKQAEMEKDRLAKAVSIVTEGIAITDEKDRYIYLNDAHARIYGYLQNELIGKTWRDITPGELLPLIERELAKTLHSQDNGVWSGEAPGLRKDGAVISTEVTATARWNEKGKYLGHICVVEDITERKRVEEALRKSEEEYRMVVNNIQEIIYRVSFKDDPFRGKMAFLSGPTEEILGFRREEFLNNSELWISLVHSDDTPALFETTRKMLSTHKPVIREFRIHHKHKPEYVWFEDKVFPQFDESGDVIGYFGVARDVSERKKAETERTRLEAQLLQAQKMEAVGQLAGGIAHDFNNILTIITGYATILQMKLQEGDPLRSNADHILTSSENAANLIKSLLTFSRKQVMNLKDVSIKEIIKRIEQFLLRIIGEDIELRTMSTDEDLTIIADSGQVEQVLMNLCTNARDAMPNGGILTIAARRVTLDKEHVKAYGYGKPGEYALITVADTGLGMDEQTREKIFEPFFTTKGLGKGTGLGLSIIYGIIKQHNGYINVYSEIGKGTIFKIYLPTVESVPKETAQSWIATPKGGTETILLAEDDTAVRELTKRVLEEFGYTVIETSDGEDAINVFVENKDQIDLLILDVLMPKKTGKEVYEEIMRMRPNIKTILISGYTKDLISKKGVVEEGLNFVEKPISPTELVKRIRETLDGGDKT